MVLEEDPECTGPGRTGSEEHARREVWGARYMGLMPTGWQPGEVDKTGRLIWTLPPPRGLTIKDHNLLGDAIDLASPARSAAIRTALFEFVEIALGMNVSVMLPSLLRGVSMLCSSFVWIRVPVVRLPQYTSGSVRFGLGCHMRRLLTRFGDNEQPLRVGVIQILSGRKKVTKI